MNTTQNKNIVTYIEKRFPAKTNTTLESLKVAFDLMLARFYAEESDEAKLYAQNMLIPVECVVVDTSILICVKDFETLEEYWIETWALHKSSDQTKEGVMFAQFASDETIESIDDWR